MCCGYTCVVGGAQCVQTAPSQHAVHQQVGQAGQVLQTQGGQVLAPAQSVSGNTTITTMSPLQQGQPQHPQQISADWGHGRAVSYLIPSSSFFVERL